MTDMPADQLFADPTLEWQQVSPKLITEHRLGWLGAIIPAVLLLAAGIALQALGRDALLGFAIPAVVLGAVGLVGWFVVAPKTATSWRYAEREQDLLVRRGRVYRRLTVVPYGRMQVIEVRSNPVSQRLGIATVTLVTASANTDAHIPGLETNTASELRDRLAAKGESAAAGL